MENYSYNIVMFAYNEERKIKNSIESVLSVCDHHLGRFIIIANGCTDNTESIIRDLQKDNNKIELQSIALGDKCNAWNTYYHTIADDANVHFFVDADVTFTENVFPKLAETLINTPESIAIAGLPFSGRNKDFYRSLVIDGVCLFGNCYGVRHEFIELVREKNFKLPIGLGWIDSIITKAINCNITNQYQTVENRITHNLECGYTFNSLSIFSKHDIKLYFNRVSRYAVGKLQEEKLNLLEFNEYPNNLNDINQQVLKDIENKVSRVPFYLKKLIIKRLNKAIKD